MKSLLDRLKRTTPVPNQLINEFYKELEPGDKLFMQSLKNYYIVLKVEDNKITTYSTVTKDKCTKYIKSNYCSCYWGGEGFLDEVPKELL